MRARLLDHCPPTCRSTIRHVVRGSRGRGGTRMGIEQQAADVSGRTRCEVRAPHMAEQLPQMCRCSDTSQQGRESPSSRRGISQVTPRCKV